jgi:hypothetical protein
VYGIDHDIERFEKSVVVIESFLPRTVKWLAQLCPIISEKIKNKAIVLLILSTRYTPGSRPNLSQETNSTTRLHAQVKQLSLTSARPKQATSPSYPLSLRLIPF